jgi:hypothetical protein
MFEVTDLVKIFFILMIHMQTCSLDKANEYDATSTAFLTDEAPMYDPECWLLSTRLLSLDTEN